MGVFSVIFSPTGGTKNVMDIFGQEFGSQGEIDITSMDALMSDFTKEDLVLFGAPCFGGRVPGIALERIGRLNSGGAKAVVVMVYGNRAYDDALLELKEAVEALGFRVIAAVAAVAEHSIMRQFGAGRPDAQDRRELAGFAGRIKAGAENAPKAFRVPGNRPYKEFGGLPLTPTVGRACIACNTCSEQCPVGAISRANPRVTDRKKCICCMRCVTACPMEARSVNKLLVTAAAAKMKKELSGRKPNELYM